MSPEQEYTWTNLCQLTAHDSYAYTNQLVNDPIHMNRDEHL